MQSKRGNIRGTKKSVFISKEKKRMIQLSLCACLFLVMLLGRSNEIIENRGSGDKLLDILRSDAEFVNAFSTLGESLSRGESIFDGIETFVADLFGTGEDERAAAAPVRIYDGPASINAVQRLSSTVTHKSMVDVLENAQYSLQVEARGENAPAEKCADTQLLQRQEQSEEVLTELEEAAPEVPAYTGPELPENATMEYRDLGLGETVTPVWGEISSEYGYRIHPLTEEYAFHAGIDIAVDTGTPIGAFADGTVEFIGESSKYGQYVQLDHGNGVKSFYCHCSELLLGKGTVVSAGQTIALAGDTGNTTGAHLHLELKKDDVLLNPIYYIETIH